MTGVFLTAAELSRRGFIVSLTSRSAAGADILITDLAMQTAWSVQVKTNAKRSPFWLLNKHVAQMASPTHIYVFVTLRGEDRPEFLVSTSEHVKAFHRPKIAKTGSVWWEFHREDRKVQGEGWEEVIGRTTARAP